MSSIKEKIAAMQNQGQTEAAPPPAPTPAGGAKSAAAALAAMQQKASAPKAPAPAPEPAKPAAPAQGVNPPEGQSALEKLQAKAAASAPATMDSASPQHQPPVPATNLAVVAGDLGYTLYIDCAPNKECIDFAQLAQPVLEQIEAEKGCHYKLIDGLYGGNGAFFAKAMELYLDQNPPVQDVLVTLASPVVKDCLEVLMARASLVVRGF